MQRTRMLKLSSQKKLKKFNYKQEYKLIIFYGKRFATKYNEAKS